MLINTEYWILLSFIILEYSPPENISCCINSVIPIYTILSLYIAISTYYQLATLIIHKINFWTYNHFNYVHYSRSIANQWSWLCQGCSYAKSSKHTHIYYVILYIAFHLLYLNILGTHNYSLLLYLTSFSAVYRGWIKLSAATQRTTSSLLEYQERWHWCSPIKIQ
jgi:hypothetical protein